MRLYQIHVCENDSVRLEPEVPVGGVNPFGKEWDEGRSIEVSMDIKFVVYLKRNKTHDWVGGYSWQPYVREPIRERLEPLLGDTAQWIGPIPCKNQSYYMLNCVNVIDCLLPQSTSNRLLFDHALLKDQLLFRPKGSVRKLIATEELRRNLLASRDSGVRLGLVRENGELTWFHDSEIVAEGGIALP